MSVLKFSQQNNGNSLTHILQGSLFSISTT